MDGRTVRRGLRAQSVIGDRMALAQQLGQLTFGDKRRDVYAAAGYDKTISHAQYLSRFLRQDVAQRVVSVAVSETWRRLPTLLDGLDEDGAEGTPFTDGWLRLAKSTADDAETRRGLAHYLARLDLVSRIGRYGVLYLGLGDSLEPNAPAAARSLKGPEGVLFASVFDEGAAKVTAWEMDKTSPRYGKPTMYRLTDSTEAGTVVNFEAHWTRCIHVADNVLTSDLFGSPALEVVWNRLIDLDKVMAATGEAGWTQMQPGYVFSTRDGYELGDDDAGERQEQMDEFVHGLRRFLEMNGYETTTLAGTLQDPSGAVNNVLKLISAASGVPLRKLTGSERGELSSTQDDDNWIDVIEARQQQHVTPAIIEPVVNRLMWLGALPAPSSGTYTVWWPSLRQKNPEQQAKIADTNASALQKIGAKVDAKAFAETYLPDLPADAVTEKPEPEPVIASPVTAEFPQSDQPDQPDDTAEGGGLAENAARPFRGIDPGFLVEVGPQAAAAVLGDRWANYP